LSVPYSIYFNTPPRDVSHILVLGSGQDAKLPKMIASFLKHPTAVIQGLPHWHAEESSSDIESFTIEFAKQSINAARNKSKNKITLIAESQAAPGAVFFAQNNHIELKSLILVQPLGLNKESYANSNLPVIKEFEKRIKSNARLQVPSMISDWRLMYNYYVLIKKRFNPVFKRKFAKHYEIGLDSDISKPLRDIAEHLGVHLIIGSQDKIFPPKEIQKTISNKKIKLASITIVDGVPHSPLASRDGKKLLSKIDALEA